MPRKRKHPEHKAEVERLMNELLDPPCDRVPLRKKYKNAMIL